MFCAPFDLSSKPPGSLLPTGHHANCGTASCRFLRRPAVASAIVGAETIDELRANATAADVELEPAQLDSLTA